MSKQRLRPSADVPVAVEGLVMVCERACCGSAFAKRSREGLARTGRVITAAAAVMVAVFASFAAGDDRVLKLFGLALATAVFLEAIVIRTVLLPAVLELLGRRTWAFPRWFDRRLPRLAIEPTTAAQPAPALEEAA